MFVSVSNNFHHFVPSPPISPGYLETISASKAASYGLPSSVTHANTQAWEDAKERIRKMFDKVEVCLSAYDTAWVAMAPSPASSATPCFPKTLDWIIEHQMPNGSWGGVDDQHGVLIKDTLSSTLACVLALNKWGLAHHSVSKGLDFIAANFNYATDEHLISPIGFDIIFASMIQDAIKSGINFDLNLTDVDAVLSRKQEELRRINSKPAKARNFYLAYISEGMTNSHDWDMAMKYQLKNGSLFNSPSTTAVAFSHLLDPRCHRYLCSVLNQFGNAVPTMYPYDVYSRLYMVDTVEKLGIDRFFKEDIERVLSEVFRQWEEHNEEIFSDIVTCAMALRLLRSHGYHVSSEALATYNDQSTSMERFGGHLEDIRASLELFKAAQFVIHPHETYLEDCLPRAKNYLSKNASNTSKQADKFTKQVTQEVVNSLKNPYHECLERLEVRKHVEDFRFDDTRVLKSSIRNANFCYEDLLNLATADFGNCQSVHLQEFKQLQRWVTESKLDQLTFSRQKLIYCYFSAATTLFSPELADARISWAKNGVLTTVVDDFFDLGSSKEEQLNLIDLVQKWDPNPKDESSEKVQIIYSAIRATVCEIAEKAYPIQGRDITAHIIQIWVNLLNSMMKEAEMLRTSSVLTLGNYMENGYTSFALGPIVLPSLYLVGPTLSSEVTSSADYQQLFKLTSTCGRLLNDIQGYQRESKEGKMNAVSLHMLHSGGAVNTDDAVTELRWIVEDKRRELLRLVLSDGGGGGGVVVPRECREVFWKMSRVLHYFYRKDDGFSSKGIEAVVNALLFHPIHVN